MEKIQLTKDCRRILQALYDSSYDINRVPEEDRPSFRILKEAGLVSYVSTKDDDIVVPRLTDTGNAYLAENPRLKNPGIFEDTKSKYIINLAISIFALIISLIAIFK